MKREKKALGIVPEIFEIRKIFSPILMASFADVLIAPGISKSLKWMRFLGPGISNFFEKKWMNL